MKQVYTLVIIIAGFLFSLLSPSPSLAAAQTDDFQRQKDSLLNVANVATGEEKIMALRAVAILPYSDYDEMFEVNENLLNEARRQGNVKAQAFAMVNELMNYYNNNRYSEYEAKADEYLQFMLSHTEGRNYYFYAYPVLLEIYIANGDYYKSLQGARQLYETAKEYDNALGIDAATYSIAVAYDKITRYDDALRFYKLTLESQKIKEVGARSYQLQTYSDLFDLICKKDLDMSPSDLAAEWRGEIIRTERESSIDHHHWAWWDYYQSMTDYFISREDLANAKLYCDSIPMYNDEAKVNALRYASKGRIAELEGDYTAAHDWFKQAEVLHLESNDEYASLDDMIRILSKMDRGREMYPLVEKRAKHIDRMHSLQHKAQLDEFRTQYEVDRHVAEKERNRNYFLLALGCCLLLAVALGIYIYYNRKLAWKNRELVRKAQQWANVESALVIADEDGETVQEAPLSKAAEPDETDKLLFAEIEQLINNGLYKESNLSLDMLAGKTSRNPTYISKAVSRCTGKTFKTWLNEYRIKEAVRLLSDRNSPNISIETAAWDSGFNDRKTFHRIFKNTTGLSPTDFKKERIT